MQFDGVFGILELVDDKGNLRHEYRMRKTNVTFGRGATNDVRLLLEEVSRSHCAIEFGGKNKVRRTNQASLRVFGTGGVTVNGKHVAPGDEKVPLASGDALKISKHHLRYKDAPQESTSQNGTTSPGKRVQRGENTPVRQSPRLKARASAQDMAKHATPVFAKESLSDEVTESTNTGCMRRSTGKQEETHVSQGSAKSSLNTSPRTPHISPKKQRNVSLRTATLLKSSSQHPFPTNSITSQQYDDNDDERDMLEVENSLELASDKSLDHNGQNEQQIHAEEHLESPRPFCATDPAFNPESVSAPHMDTSTAEANVSLAEPQAAPVKLNESEHHGNRSSPPMTLSDLSSPKCVPSNCHVPAENALTAESNSPAKAPFFNTPQPVRKVHAPRPSEVPALGPRHKSSFSWLARFISPKKQSNNEPQEQPPSFTSDISMSLVTDDQSGINDSMNCRSMSSSGNMPEEGNEHDSNVMPVAATMDEENTKDNGELDNGELENGKLGSDELENDELENDKLEKVSVNDIDTLYAEMHSRSVPEAENDTEAEEVELLHESPAMEAAELNLEDNTTCEERGTEDDEPQDIIQSATDVTLSGEAMGQSPNKYLTERNTYRDSLHASSETPTETAEASLTQAAEETLAETSAVSCHESFTAANNMQHADTVDKNAPSTPDLAVLKHMFADPKEVLTPDIRHFIRRNEREAMEAGDMSMGPELNALLQTPAVRRSARTNKPEVSTAPLARRTTKEPFIPTRRMNTRATANEEIEAKTGGNARIVPASRLPTRRSGGNALNGPISNSDIRPRINRKISTDADVQRHHGTSEEANGIRRVPVRSTRGSTAR